MYEVRRSEQRGRFCVASMDIEVGATVLRELPIAHALSDEHASTISPTPASTSSPRYPLLATTLAIRVLRACQSSNDARRHFESMHHLSSRPANEEGLRACASLVSAAVPGISVGRAVLALQRLSVNAFTITDHELSAVGVACFGRGACFNHACEPNLVQSFEGTELVLRTRSKVTAGDELTISYIDVMCPSWRRRHELMQSYGFNCLCVRCCVADPIDDAFLCPRPGCSGRLDPDHREMYAEWLNNQSRAVEAISCPMLSAGGGRVTRELICSACRRKHASPPLMALLSRLTPSYSRRPPNHPELVAVLRDLTRLLGKHHWTTVRAMASLVEALISARLFPHAARLSEECVHLARPLVPSFMPIAQIYLLRAGKLLLLEESEDAVRRGARLVQEAISALDVTHGPKHPLTVEARKILL